MNDKYGDTFQFLRKIMVRLEHSMFIKPITDTKNNRYYAVYVNHNTLYELEKEWVFDCLWHSEETIRTRNGVEFSRDVVPCGMVGMIANVVIIFDESMPEEGATEFKLYNNRLLDLKGLIEK